MEVTVLQGPKAMWVLREKQALRDSRETMGPRDSPAPRDPLALLGRRVPLETQEFQASQEPMALWATQAMRDPRERKVPRVHQGRQALRAILDLGV